MHALISSPPVGPDSGDVSPPQLLTRAHLYEGLGLQQFQDDLRPQRLALCRSLLQGLAQAMALPNPPNSCWTLLCSTTEKIFTLLPNHIQVQGWILCHSFYSTHGNYFKTKHFHTASMSVCAGRGIPPLMLSLSFLPCSFKLWGFLWKFFLVRCEGLRTEGLRTEGLRTEGVVFSY